MMSKARKVVRTDSSKWLDRSYWNLKQEVVLQRRILFYEITPDPLPVGGFHPSNWIDISNHQWVWNGRSDAQIESRMNSQWVESIDT